MTQTDQNSWYAVFSQWRTYVVAIAGWVLGLGTQEYVRIWVDQAEITGKPRALVFTRDMQDVWEVFLNIKVSNTGNSDITAEVSEFKLEFPTLSTRPIIYKVGRTISVPAHRTIDDTLTVKFASGFFSKIRDFQEFPHLKGGSLELLSPDGDTLASVRFDSADVHQFFQLETGTPTGPEHFPGAVSEGHTDQFMIPVKLFPISFQGQVYSVLIYPPSTVAEYKIVDGRIKLELTQSNSAVAAGAVQLMPPPEIFPHPAIADKIDVAPNIGLDVLAETRSPDTITYEMLKVPLGTGLQDKQRYVFVFE